VVHRLRQWYERRQQAFEDELNFPDEVSVPPGTAARVRFMKYVRKGTSTVAVFLTLLCRYRGLESFRNSPWDPREDLPSEYNSIVMFKSLKRSRQSAWAVEGEVQVRLCG
jgi:pre-rRNA-processing protein TSR1